MSGSNPVLRAQPGDELVVKAHHLGEAERVYPSSDVYVRHLHR